MSVFDRSASSFNIWRQRPQGWTGSPPISASPSGRPPTLATAASSPFQPPLPPFSIPPVSPPRLSPSLAFFTFAPFTTSPPPLPCPPPNQPPHPLPSSPSPASPLFDP